MNILKKLTLIAMSCASTAIYAMQELPRLKYGSLTLHNTLNEAVAYYMTTSINAQDPERDIRIINGDKKIISYGEIPAQTIQKMPQVFHVKDQRTQEILSVFGGIVYLRLQRQNQHNNLERNLEQPGTYVIGSNEQGELTLSQSIAEEKSAETIAQ